MIKPNFEAFIKIGDYEIRRLIHKADQNNENLGEAYFQFKEVPKGFDTLYNIKIKQGGEGNFDLVCGKRIYRLLVEISVL